MREDFQDTVCESFARQTYSELEVDILVLAATLLNILVQCHRHRVYLSIRPVPPADVENLHTSTFFTSLFCLMGSIHRADGMGT